MDMELGSTLNLKVVAKNAGGVVVVDPNPITVTSDSANVTVSAVAADGTFTATAAAVGGANLTASDGVVTSAAFALNVVDNKVATLEIQVA